MFVPQRDFFCVLNGEVLSCRGELPAENVYKQLQALLQQYRQDVPSDGVITPTTALAVWRVLGALHQTEPLSEALRPIVFGGPEDPCVYVAAHAREILVYTQRVLAQHPDALFVAHPAAPPEPTLADALKIIPVKPLAIGVGALALLGGLGYATYRSSQRGAGVEDRSSFLPESELEDSDGAGAEA